MTEVFGNILFDAFFGGSGSTNNRDNPNTVTGCDHHERVNAAGNCELDPTWRGY